LCRAFLAFAFLLVFTHLPWLSLRPLGHVTVFFVFVVAAGGGGRFPPGACETLPGTSSGAGFVNGPWHASPEQR
jgi:hypothetical protein